MSLKKKIRARLFDSHSLDNVEYLIGVMNKAKENGILSYYFKIKWQKICEKCNASIPLHTKWGGVPVFPHSIYGIFISCEATIGKGCTIFQQVTIGSNALKDSKNCGAPTIGNNVYIGAGAKIIGNVRVGNNVRVGSNCVVTEDIPDNATVVLGKSIVIIHDKPRDNTYVPIGALDIARKKCTH